MRAPDLLGALLGGVGVAVEPPRASATVVTTAASSDGAATRVGAGGTATVLVNEGVGGAPGGGAAGTVIERGAGVRGGAATTVTSGGAGVRGGAATTVTSGGVGAGGAIATAVVGEGASGGLEIETVRVDTDVAIARRRVGRGVRLTDLVEGGWVVDGARVRLDDMVALGGGAGASAVTTGAGGSGVAIDTALLSGGSIGAWAELEHTELPTTGGETRLVVRVQGLAPSVPRARLRVHLVIDRSSSMDGTWHHVLAAARQLVSRLSPNDVLQIVTYADRAEEVFGPMAVGDGRDALARLERVEVGGGTNIEAGVSLAYRSIARIPDMPGDRSVVFLVSDGRPNIGAFAADDFARLTIEARARGCTTAVFGLGDEFDGDVLRAIARAGRGSYYVARTAAELTQPLVNELGVQERVSGLDVRVRVRLPAAVIVRGVEGADAGTAGNVLTATFPVLRVGEERRIVLSLGVRASIEPRDIAAVDVAYRASASAPPIAGARRVRVAFAGAPRYAGASVGVSLLDQDLARSLDEAGTAIRIGDGARASRVLADHVALVRARPDLARLAPVRARTDSIARLATGVSAMLPAAREPERRLVGLALGSAAVRMGR